MTEKRSLTVTDARKGKIVTETNFRSYDYGLNTYVGCEFGCKYCYVRFFIKDEKPWGEFVRLRNHLENRLPKELPGVAGSRLVMGTMTDPYQPVERKHRLTRRALEMIDASERKPSKVGIFTRSPIVLDDLELIARMPKARVHFSVTPFTRDIMTKIEGIPVQTKARWAVVRKLKAAGIRVHVNVAPAIPVVSDALIEEYCAELVSCGVDEFFVDPMQTYSEAFRALGEAMEGDPAWPEVQRIMTDKKAFAAWKAEYRLAWRDTWTKAGAPEKTLAIWCDHASHTWEKLLTGEVLDMKNYHGDAPAGDAHSGRTIPAQPV